MEDLDIIGTIAKIIGAVPSATYVPVVLLIPLAISFFTELVKNAVIVLRGSISSVGKTNIQAGLSICFAVITMFLLYGKDETMKELIVRTILFAMLVAKLSSYYYKGLPLANLIPGLRNLNTKSLFSYLAERDAKVEAERIEGIG